jgi:hypothetical protein
MHRQCPCIPAGMPHWTSRVACPRPAPRPALRAGRLPKPPVPQRFPHSCTPFSPVRVDNVLAQAPVPAQSPPPRSAQAAPRRCPRRGCQPQHGGRRPWLAHERWPQDTGCAAVSGPTCTALRRQGRSVARAEGPTPPSSMAAPSGTPPRRCLRSVQSTTGLHTRGRKETPVCAAARGPVRAAAETAPC